jgi:hypothetical protein
MLTKLKDRLRPHNFNARVAFRWWVAGCQAATLLITWPLWQVHRSPPMLPVLPLPQLDTGVALLLSLAVVFIAPVTGIILHTVLIVYAMLIDQTRIQPQLMSHTILLWGTLCYLDAKTLSRAYLVAMWTWAGLNKLLSPAFLSDVGPSLFGTLFTQAPVWLRENGGYAIAISELATGLMAALPRTRRLCGFMAFGLHISILLTLVSLRANRNEAIWPWNLALALSAFSLIAPWQESIPRSIGQSQLGTRLIIVLILVLPAGFHFGLIDTYFAHNLYSGNTPIAASSAFNPASTRSEFNVPLPPEHRLYEQWFHLVCKPGDHLTIIDPRWWFRIRGQGERELACTSQ